MMPASREARQVQRLSMSTRPFMTRPARYDDLPSCTTPLSSGGVQFEEITLPAASKDRAFLTASQPADFMKKASVNSVKLIRTILPDIALACHRRSPARTRVGRWMPPRLGPDMMCSLSSTQEEGRGEGGH